LVFASGKVVFTGAKCKDDIDRGFIELRSKLMEFAVE
jgi:TATA-box binding protein (TBP) (component of TFIID and TFIIIB)